ncbi:MAG: amidophosphoribosyltransferase, partial [Vicinamibacteria bacterium]
MSGFKDECGVFGIVGHTEAAAVTYLGLYALQHRGQEAAGIVTAGRGKDFRTRKARGYVADLFDADSLEKLGGPNAIGHTRYSTAGDNTDDNIQPLHIECKFGEIAVCHNGNLVNAHLLRRELVEAGSIFRTTSDTEVILHLLANPAYADQPDPLAAVLRELRGAYCLLFIFPDRIEAARDPFG